MWTSTSKPDGRIFGRLSREFTRDATIQSIVLISLKLFVSHAHLSYCILFTLTPSSCQLNYSSQVTYTLDVLYGLTVYASAAVESVPSKRYARVFQMHVLSTRQRLEVLNVVVNDFFFLENALQWCFFYQALVGGVPFSLNAHQFWLFMYAVKFQRLFAVDSINKRACVFCVIWIFSSIHFIALQ